MATKQTEITDADILNALAEPLPQEAVTQFQYNGQMMTGYRAQYIIERLNSIFGFMWDFDIVQENGKYMMREEDGFVGAYCVLSVYNIDDKGNKTVAKQVKQWGESSVSDDSIHGDKVFGWPSACKAAMTDGLCKCASYLGVGADAYKGKVAAVAPKTLSETDTLVNSIKKEAKLRDMTDKALVKLCKETLDRIEKVVLSELDVEDLNKILEAVKAIKDA